LVNETRVSIHHIVKPALFFAVAFIFNERAARMVNRWFAPLRCGLYALGACEPAVKLIGVHQRIG
jgi:hypothetical protein